MEKGFNRLLTGREIQKAKKHVKKLRFLSPFKKLIRAVAGGLSWLEQSPILQKALGLIPSQGTYLDCGFDSQSGCMWEAIDQCFCLSLPIPATLSPSFPLFLKSIKHILE